CGGGALGEPERKGEGQCGNMRLLQKQRKRVLMGRSDVAGWGIFLQPIRNHFLKAGFRGFFWLQNDANGTQNQIELKFANHSANPNCYARVLKVAGDDRLGIYAKKHIEAGEEIFYDYCYPNDLAPVWALKPDDPKEGPSAPQAGARKPPSHQSPLPRSPLAGPPLAPPSPRPPMDR
nr:histone-lysine N-methyltransferase EZA1 isoform X1 [Tanacetum cinerariifolium]